MLAGSRRFDRGVQCKEIRLIRNSTDRPRDFADILRASLELGDIGDRRQLTFRIALDRADRRADLRRASASVAIKASERRPDFSASPRVAVKFETIRLIAADCSCDAPAASAAPLAICSREVSSSRVADAACVNPLASSSVAAATRSKTVCCLGGVREACGFAGAFALGAFAAVVGFAVTAAIFDFLTNAISPRKFGVDSDGGGAPDRAPRSMVAATRNAACIGVSAAAAARAASRASGGGYGRKNVSILPKSMIETSSVNEIAAMIFARSGASSDGPSASTRRASKV